MIDLQTAILLSGLVLLLIVVGVSFFKHNSGERKQRSRDLDSSESVPQEPVLTKLSDLDESSSPRLDGGHQFFRALSRNSGTAKSVSGNGGGKREH